MTVFTKVGRFIKEITQESKAEDLERIISTEQGRNSKDTSSTFNNLQRNFIMCLKKWSPEIISILYFTGSTLLKVWPDYNAYGVSDIADDMLYSGLETLIVYPAIYDQSYAKKLTNDALKREKSRIFLASIPLGIALWYISLKTGIEQDVLLIRRLIEEYAQSGFRKARIVIEPRDYVTPVKAPGITTPETISNLVSYTSAWLCSAILPVVSATYIAVDYLKNFRTARRIKNHLSVLSASLKTKQGRYSDAIALLRANEQDQPHNYRLNLDISLAYARQSDYDSAFLEIKKAAEKITYKDMVEFRGNALFERLIALDKLQREKRRTKLERAGTAPERSQEQMLVQCYVAYLAKVLGFKNKCLKELWSGVQMFPESMELKALYAEELEHQGRHDDALNVHKGVYEHLHCTRPDNFERCGESAKNVFNIGEGKSALLNTIYIYKAQTEDEAEIAISNSETARQMLATSRNHIENIMKKSDAKEQARLERILYSVSKAAIPEEYGVVTARTKKEGVIETEDGQDKEELNDKVIQIMRRGIGPTFNELIIKDKDAAKRYLSDIATILALIHSRTITSGRAKKNRQEYFGQRCDAFCARFKVPSYIHGLLLGSYISDGYFIGSEVFNKDAHPENWVISHGLAELKEEERIFSIDWDEKGVTDQSDDLVNLLDYAEWPDAWTKRAIAKQYFEDFCLLSGYGLPSEDRTNKFINCYLNSVFERGFALCYAWSDPQRPGMHHKIPGLIRNMINATTQLEVYLKAPEDVDVYKKHNLALVARRLNLRGLLEHVTPLIN